MIVGCLSPSRSSKPFSSRGACWHPRFFLHTSIGHGGGTTSRALHLRRLLRPLAALRVSGPRPKMRGLAWELGPVALGCPD